MNLLDPTIIAPRKYKTTRKLELPWLDSAVPKGKTVYEYRGHTYGCISPTGAAVTDDAFGGIPFYEVPQDALEPA